MNILFLGTYIPQNKLDNYKALSSYIDYPGLVLQNSLYCGFADSGANVTSVVIPNLKTKITNSFIHAEDFIWNNNNNNHSINYINIHGIKELVTPFTILSYLKKCNCEFDVVFIYSIGALQYRTANLIHKAYPGVKIVSIIADLPEYMNFSSSFLFKAMKKIEWKIIQSNMKYISGYIFLSPLMLEKLPIKDKPWIQMEGIYNPNEESESSSKSDIKYILYSGALEQKYGVNDLVDAFLQIENRDIELWLCGYGSSTEYIKSSAKKDPRIKFLGILPHKDVLVLQKNAHLLVNPRHSSEVFTKYSFPSKTMEYLASGTPTLMSHLACIPAEYEEHLYFFDDESVNGMVKTIEKILRMNVDVLKDKGNKAKNFILDCKNPRKQCLRIVRFIESIQ